MLVASNVIKPHNSLGMRAGVTLLVCIPCIILAFVAANPGMQGTEAEKRYRNSLCGVAPS